jgi:cob(I)alamin adenosyltransferase|uniref:corrinoid adenosyltransferase n=1 Tax=Desulfobacca acetoxidans TaxID=60893 RepID=A0A7C5AMB3_9BACT
MNRLAEGRLQVYTGSGKGKTTAALGLALRALGRGLKVYIIQFLKGRETGESRVAARLAPGLTLRFFGQPGFGRLKSPGPEDRRLLGEAWDLAREVIRSGEHDLVILDEINLALANELLPLSEVLEVLRHRPSHVEVVLTGRHAPPALLELADLVTEMHPLRHYLKAGVRARAGIEW